MTEIEAVIGVGRNRFDGIVFHDEIAKAVKNRLTLVGLHAERQVMTVPSHHVSAGIDGLTREIAGEIGGHIEMRNAAVAN